MEKHSKHDDSEAEEELLPALTDPSLSADLDPAPVPERNSDNFVCLRGPCRHYWHLVTMAHLGNPGGTWDHLGIEAPRQHHHVCLVNPGFETSFTEDNVYECSRWEPMTGRELKRIERRRSKYLRVIK